MLLVLPRIHTENQSVSETDQDAPVIKDFRDWVNAGHTFDDLLALAEATPPYVVEKTEDGEIDLKKAEFPAQEQILRKLQLEVLYEDVQGSIRVFSSFLGKSSTIKDAHRVHREHMIQYCGAPAMTYISAEPDHENTFGMPEVREAIAFAASSRRGKNDDHGIGIWQGRDESGNEKATIILANDSKAASWSEDTGLIEVVTPRVYGLTLDFGAGQEDWFEFDQLKLSLESAARKEWCEAVIEEAYNLFAQWKWSNGAEIDAMVLTGLVIASWVQSVWAWRPQVSITGDTNTGKTSLFESLGGRDQGGGIFGNLASKQSGSSAAGIRQGIGNSGCIILYDEFEKSPHRKSILEMFRPSSRGAKITRGTRSQITKEFSLNHIFWVASIESGLLDQADINRFISLELHEVSNEEFGRLSIPDGPSLRELGQKLLAVAVRHALAAKEMAIKIKDTRVEGVSGRFVESYAVPAAMLGVPMGMDEKQCRALLKDLLAGMKDLDQGESAHQELLEAILGSEVYCGHKDGNLTVSQILEAGEQSSFYMEHFTKLESKGIRLLPDGNLFIRHPQVQRTLLKNTKWEEKKLRQLLSRIPGANDDKRHEIAGKSARGFTIPKEVIWPDDINPSKE